MKIWILGGALLVVSAGALVFLASCVKTAPSGKAVDAAGVERDPSVMLQVGEVAPSFEVTDHTGATVRSSEFLGKQNVVLIFYPGNETPGCTKQLCSARDDFSKYQGKDAVVFGVNPAGEQSHASFASNHNFPFPLLADTDGRMVRDFGCRGLGGITTRTVYVIGKDGKVVFAERGMPSTDKILASIS